MSVGGVAAGASGVASETDSLVSLGEAVAGSSTPGTEPRAVIAPDGNTAVRTEGSLAIKRRETLGGPLERRSRETLRSSPGVGSSPVKGGSVSGAEGG